MTTIHLTAAELIEIRQALDIRVQGLRIKARKANNQGLKVSAAMDTRWADTSEQALSKLDGVWEADLVLVERREG